MSEEKKLGRPSTGEARNKIVRVRVNKGEKGLLDAAAKARGTELSTWARGELLRLAGELLSKGRLDTPEVHWTPEDMARLKRLAAAEHLHESVWARQQILKALDAWEKQHPSVAKQPLPSLSDQE